MMLKVNSFFVKAFGSSFFLDMKLDHKRKPNSSKPTKSSKSSKNSQKGYLLNLFLIGLLVGCVVMASLAYWAQSPVEHQNNKTSIDLDIEPGQSVRQIVSQSVHEGFLVNEQLQYLLFKFSGVSREIKAGSYELGLQVSPWDFVQKVTRGDETLKSITFIEGWNFRQLRAALNKAPDIKHDTLGLSDEEIMSRLGVPNVLAEGHFFPDTYTFGHNSSDLKVLARAYKSMNKHLAQAWDQQEPNLKGIPDPESALILASIIEKETGQAKDREMISSVFHNRLAINMPLQTDPTVIYGLGEGFNGNLTKQDLKTDHPWNTYTRLGLPPTAICMPGKMALFAALHPAKSQALYFVAKGDGSSQFSDTLQAHNAAVDRYQRTPHDK